MHIGPMKMFIAALFAAASPHIVLAKTASRQELNVVASMSQLQTEAAIGWLSFPEGRTYICSIPRTLWVDISPETILGPFCQKLKSPSEDKFKFTLPPLPPVKLTNSTPGVRRGR